eukprot:scaffold328920_cov52-Tisochrysis_lutea.AAC.7
MRKGPLSFSIVRKVCSSASVCAVLPSPISSPRITFRPRRATPPAWTSQSLPQAHRRPRSPRAQPSPRLRDQHRPGRPRCAHVPGARARPPPPKAGLTADCQGAMRSPPHRCPNRYPARSLRRRAPDPACGAARPPSTPPPERPTPSWVEFPSAASTCGTCRLA